MGMYTTVAVNAELKPEFYGLADKLSGYVEDYSDNCVVTDEDPFFNDSRWMFCTNGGQVLDGLASEYMDIFSVPFLEEQNGRFKSSGDLKNYDNTINKYFNYLVPKLAYEDGRYETTAFAATQYEENNYLVKYFISSTGKIRSEQEEV